MFSDLYHAAERIGCSILLTLAAVSCSRTEALQALPQVSLDDEETVNLRGFGQVTPFFSDDFAAFLCEDPEHSQIVASKLAKDLSSFGARPALRRSLKVSDEEIPYFQLSEGMTALVLSKDNICYVFGFEREDALAGFAKQSLNLEEVIFPDADAHPKFLDYYDNNSMRFYTRAMEDKGEGMASHWELVKRLGLGGLSVQDPSILKSPAPGILPYAAVDYELAEASRQDGFIVLGPTVGGSLPLWMYNDAPDHTAALQDASLFGGWSHGTFAATVESDGEAWDPENSPILAMHRQIVERYRDNPNLGGWHLNRGQPVGDMIGTLMDGTLWDGSKVAEDAMRAWLQARYTLPELGERWHGDSAFYQNWETVVPDQLMDVVGGQYESERLLLSDRPWQWKKGSGEQDGLYPTDSSAVDWLTFDWAPSQRAMFLDSGSSFFRLEFEDADYFSKHSGDDLYLKFVGYAYVGQRMIAWVNGQKFESPVCRNSGVAQEAIRIPADVFHASGSNEIIFQTPEKGRSDGRIHGPISISPLPAQAYPYADPHLNAIYTDTMLFKVDAACRRIIEAIRWGRQFDSERPLVISGGWWPTMATLASVAGPYGVGLQYTAVEGFYCDWYAEIARVYGSYFSAEPSGAVLDPERFDRMLGMLLYRGDSSLDLFHNVEQYVKFDRETGYLTERAPLIRQIGKSLNAKPELALFTSKISQILGASSFWTWNLGRGELESIHVPSTYLSESELKKGFADDYPVLFDTGSSIMTDETVDSLYDYVERGGTFVSIPSSGRHTPLEYGAQPIAKLTGFKVEPTRAREITWNRDLPMFSAWAGQTMNGVGAVQDWQGLGNEGTAAVGLTSIGPDTGVLARWDDGTPAVGLRRIGKGRVITLGATFWRQAKDITGKWLPIGSQDYLETLINELGISREVDASSPKIWVRKAVTKNGLEDWLIAANIAERAPFAVDADLEITLDYRPADIVEVTTGESVPFRVESGGRVVVPGVKFDKYQTRIFAASRPESVPDLLQTWWREKTTYWHASPSEVLPLPKPFDADTIPLNPLKFRTDPEKTIVKDRAWKLPAYDDSEWETLPAGSWKLLDGELQDYEGLGLYRFSFEVPDHWTGSRVTLNFMPGVAATRAVFYINGHRVAVYSAQGHNVELISEAGYDITDWLVLDGPNVIAVEVTGGEGILSGLCGTAWLGTEKTLDPLIDLNGVWDCIAADQQTTKEVSVPGAPSGRFLRRTFSVPADWEGREVFVQLVTPSPWCGAVVVNGKAKSKNYAFGPFGTRLELNVTELLEPGQENVIELWHRYTIPVNWRGKGWNWPSESALPVKSIHIGCVD